MELSFAVLVPEELIGKQSIRSHSQVVNTT